MPEQIDIAARHDAHLLAGELFLPRSRPRAAVLIAPAMAVPASFYSGFAGFLAEQGAAALTIDYRGIGRSRRGSLRGFRSTFHARVLFRVAIPTLAGICGFLPMSWFGQGEDVPRGVALEWAQWGRHPRYIYSYAAPRGGLGFDRFAGPIRSLSINDDAYAPRSGVEALLQLYSKAEKELVVVAPPAHVGHFGWFRHAELWPTEVEWLLRE